MRTRTVVRRIAMTFLLAAFLISAGTVTFVKRQYHASQELYREASERYTVRVQPLAAAQSAPAPAASETQVMPAGMSTPETQTTPAGTSVSETQTTPAGMNAPETPAAATEIPAAPNETERPHSLNRLRGTERASVLNTPDKPAGFGEADRSDSPEETAEPDRNRLSDSADRPELRERMANPDRKPRGKKDAGPLEYAPIAVDFEALREVNPDIVGWIYCEDTVINYPVVQAEDNDYYLHRNYDGTYNVSGSIFVEANNRPGFLDCDTILYGHHMNDGSMFACIDNWGKQAYYEEHPVLWLLTPEQDYKVVLFSGYTTSAFSETYDIYPEPGPEWEAFRDGRLEKSDFLADVDLTGCVQTVTLSTCAYVFDFARHVLHGALIPVGHALDLANDL